MGFLDWLKPTKIVQKSSKWKEYGGYNSTFIPFGTNLYKSDLVRSCIRPLAEHTSKANARCSNERLQYILNYQPNMYMNGADLLKKVRTILELKNTAFIFIHRDKAGHADGFYPVPYEAFEALEYMGNLFVRFDFANGEKLVCPWEDLAVLRRDYNMSDIAGDDNTAIIEMLNTISTTNQGVANAVKATANLRGILKSKQAMLANEDIKKQKDAFVNDYVNLENSSGIASLDSSMDFVPVTMQPAITNAATMKEFRENVLRYFGVSDAILMSDYTEQQMEAFYDAKIEPFLVALSLELTRKVFTEREKGFGNFIIYEANKLQFASMSTKISLFKEIVLYGGMTINEWRAGNNMPPLEGGDVPIRRLDADVVDVNPDDDNSDDDKKEDEDDQQE